MPLVSERIPIHYRAVVNVPADLQKFLWDYPEGKAPLEKLLLRTLEYGSFEQVKRIYRRYPEECYDVVNRYQHLKRGIKYWIREWS